jgi:hypothetical protein
VAGNSSGDVAVFVDKPVQRVDALNGLVNRRWQHERWPRTGIWRVEIQAADAAEPCCSDSLRYC